ncbi:MAG: 4Fe-4S binding protein [Chloroflexota bacterium]
MKTAKDSLVATKAMPFDKRPWQDLPFGGVVIEAGSAAAYQTGDWRGALHPVLDVARCTSCMLCWVYCPDAAIVADNGKVVGINYDYCKGCGICAVECPVRPEAAIKMMAAGEEA